MNYLVLMIGVVVVVSIFVKYVKWVLNQPDEPGVSKSGPVSNIPNNSSKIPTDTLADGFKLISNKEFSQAVHYFTNIIKAEPDNFRAHNYLAVSYVGVGDVMKAIDCYHECVRLGTNYNVFENLSKLYKDCNYFEKAVNRLEQLFKQNPSDSYLCLLLGVSYLGCNSLSKAEKLHSVMCDCGTKRAGELLQRIDQYRINNQNTHSGSKSNFNAVNKVANKLQPYYSILEISVDASNDEIKQAYRELAKVWHPDRFAHDPKLQAKAEHKMKIINDAYNRLCNS